MMGDSAKKQEALNALNGISYNDWMEIKFKIDKYFSDQLSKYENSLNLIHNTPILIIKNIFVGHQRVNF